MDQSPQGQQRQLSIWLTVEASAESVPVPLLLRWPDLDRYHYQPL